MRIIVVAFRDDQKRSVAYREFKTIEGAVKFYTKYLSFPNVRTISTRKVEEGVRLI